jgi:phospholipid/cholesterol/gamma-HCH transport system substrate-binding protein
MTGRLNARGLLVIGSCAILTATGCAFQGINSLPLPGAVGRGPGASIYHVELANVGHLESNSPVMINDVVVGSVGKMTVRGWHADVEVSVKPDVLVPANAVAKVGQTSLLGSMHMELNPPLGQAPRGRLKPGATIPLEKSSTYPSTEQTLALLSVVINSGGLAQIGDIIHNVNAALSGREGQIRDLLTRLDSFVGTLDRQRDKIIAAIQGLNRLADTFAGERDVITQALRRLPPALEVLIRERPRITEALDKLRVFGDTATRLVNDTQADLVKNLQNLEPTIRALADVGPDLGTAIAYTLTPFPYSQNLIDRAVKGDYINIFVAVDFTIPRLKRTLLLGTRWGQLHAPLVPAPGEPWYQEYTNNPLAVGLTPPPTGGPLPGGAPLAAQTPTPANVSAASTGALPSLAAMDTGALPPIAPLDTGGS